MTKYLTVFLLILAVSGCEDAANAPEPYLPELDTIEGVTDAYRMAFIVNDQDLLDQVCLPEDRKFLRGMLDQINKAAKENDATIDIGFENAGSWNNGTTRSIDAQFFLISKKGKREKYKGVLILAFEKQDDQLWKYSAARTKAISEFIINQKKLSEESQTPPEDKPEDE
ncbi:MAG: hypothetical protein L3J82_01000 [Planctomycetes bacterium]|nr:hypothetical protein [Planctomycetota bacterium]